MTAKLYAVYTSHPSHTARLMLEHKGLEHRVVWLTPGLHAAAVRVLGFRGGTVPALRLDGRRIQGTREIARALDAAAPEPSLQTSDPRVEAAERWGDEVLQPAPRRIGNWVFAHRPEMGERLSREAGLPLPRVAGAIGRPLTWFFARKHGAADAQRTIAELPGLLDRVDALLADGTIGGPQRNAADFQIGTSVRLLLTIADLAPALDGRPAARFALDLMPEYPTGIPAGMLPPDWLAPLR
jgi:glutathione S-transferase